MPVATPPPRIGRYAPRAKRPVSNERLPAAKTATPVLKVRKGKARGLINR